jgi:putative hydrolases of HD superfamily
MPARSSRPGRRRPSAPPPTGSSAGLRGLWDEFEERRTPEARFARALDRLQPMLANLEAGGGTWKEHGITADQVLAKVALIEDGSPTLGGFARDLVDRAVRDGLLAPAADSVRGSGNPEGTGR